MVSTPRTESPQTPQTRSTDSTPPTAVPASKHDLWSFPNYRLLWTGTLLTQTGSWMQQVAQGWLVLQLTNSPLALGMVGFVRGMPTLLLSLPGGVLVDRFDRRKLLVSLQFISAVLAAILALLVGSGHIQYWQLLLLVFLTGSVSAVIGPARQALVPATVDRAHIASAVAVNSAGQNSTRIVGPWLSGLLAAVNLAICFWAQTVALVGALWMTWRMKLPPAENTTRGSMVRNLAEGLAYIRQDATLTALLILAAVPALFAMPYFQFIPIFARDILHTGPEGLGVLLTFNGIGALMGSLAGATAGRFRRVGFLMLAMLFLYALTIIGFALSTSFALSAFMLWGCGFSSCIYMALNNTLLHLYSSDAMRGRVMSAYMLTWGFAPLGGLPLGALATQIGTPFAVVTGGAISALCVILVSLWSSEMRTLQPHGKTDEA